MHLPQPSSIFKSLNSNPPPIQQQQGMALLTILLIVVAITIVAGSMLANQKIMIREYELTKNQGEFKEYALAGESHAVELIATDSQLNQVDSLQDSWAKPIPDFILNQAKISVKLQDEASLFNINNLYHDGKVDNTAVAFFKALLQANGLSPNLAMAVLDWQDPDSQPSQDGGAEADFYQSTGKKMPMTIANQPLVSVDELQYIRGMDAQSVNKLKPYLTAVPYYLPMNVNTVKPELLAILPTVASQLANLNTTNPTNTTNNTNTVTASPPAATAVTDATSPTDPAILAWATARTNNLPIQSVAQFWALPSFASIEANQRNQLTPLFDTQSRGFRVYVTVSAEGKQTFFTSQIAKILPDTVNPSLASPPTALPTAVANTTSSPPKVVAFNRQFLPFLATVSQ